MRTQPAPFHSVVNTLIVSQQRDEVEGRWGLGRRCVRRTLLNLRGTFGIGSVRCYSFATSARQWVLIYPPPPSASVCSRMEPTETDSNWVDKSGPAVLRGFPSPPLWLGSRGWLRSCRKKKKTHGDTKRWCPGRLFEVNTQLQRPHLSGRSPNAWHSSTTEEWNSVEHIPERCVCLFGCLLGADVEKLLAFNT